jgi:hypothetical protein
MKCKVCHRELYFYLPTGEYFHNTGERVDHEAVVDNRAPAAPVVTLDKKPDPIYPMGSATPPTGTAEAYTAGLVRQNSAPVPTYLYAEQAPAPALTPCQRRLLRSIRLRRRTAAWEALQWLRRLYPWRILTKPIGIPL